MQIALLAKNATNIPIIHNIFNSDINALNIAFAYLLESINTLSISNYYIGKSGFFILSFVYVKMCTCFG